MTNDEQEGVVTLWRDHLTPDGNAVSVPAPDEPWGHANSKRMEVLRHALAHRDGLFRAIYLTGDPKGRPKQGRTKHADPDLTNYWRVTWPGRLLQRRRRREFSLALSFGRAPRDRHGAPDRHRSYISRSGYPRSPAPGRAATPAFSFGSVEMDSPCRALPCCALKFSPREFGSYLLKRRHKTTLFQP
jgi:hypothetical protein